MIEDYISNLFGGAKRKSPKRKSPKRKSKGKSPKQKSKGKGKSPKRKSKGQGKSPKRKSKGKSKNKSKSKRKSPKRKSKSKSKSKSPKRKSPTKSKLMSRTELLKWFSKKYPGFRTDNWSKLAIKEFNLNKKAFDDAVLRTKQAKRITVKIDDFDLTQAQITAFKTKIYNKDKRSPRGPANKTP